MTQTTKRKERETARERERDEKYDTSENTQHDTTKIPCEPRISYAYVNIIDYGLTNVV